MLTLKEKGRRCYFAMLKENNPLEHKKNNKEWETKNKARRKVYHRTNMRKVRVSKQKVSDRVRALRHLANHLTKRMRYYELQGIGV